MKRKLPVSLEDIERAATLIRGQVEETPCVHTRTLSQITGADIYLKLENLQFTASFKDRGALVKLLSLSDRDRAGGIIAMSAGNHAQAVAYHAQRLGIDAVIVMPRFTPAIKTERTRAFGAEVVLHGDSFDEAGAHAKRLASERGLLMVHPYDDEKIIAGQGTAALEMLRAQPQLDTLLVPIGGGGLIAGSAIAAKAIKPEIRVVSVETENFPSMRRAVDGAEPQFGAFTIADGIAVKQPGSLTLPVVRELVDEIVLVDDETIERAVLLLLEVEKTVVEGAGAVGLAALLKWPAQFTG
ncbi:MAG: pyridoxal-phosphate dependent enzyme, partial [Pseudomonadota bacterium]